MQRLLPEFLRRSVSLSKRRGPLKGGFSLVEVVLALGVCSFAMMAMMGMIPIGLSTFREAMNTTAQSQIFEGIAGDLLRSDRDHLTAEPTFFYYNEQGISRNSREAPDVAYTAKVYSPEPLATLPGDKICIEIASTPDGIDFESVKTRLPSHVFSSAVVVAKVTP